MLSGVAARTARTATTTARGITPDDVRCRRRRGCRGFLRGCAHLNVQAAEEDEHAVTCCGRLKSITVTEAIMEPNGMTDVLLRESIPVLAVKLVWHRPTLPVMAAT